MRSRLRVVPRRGGRGRKKLLIDLLEWMTEWGEKIEKLEKMAEAGMEVPALERKPDLTGYEWIWEAFFELGTCRSIGMAIGPIPWTAIRDYRIDHDMDVEESYILSNCIRAMDRKWLELNAKKASSGKREITHSKPGAVAKAPPRPGRR